MMIQRSHGLVRNGRPPITCILRCGALAVILFFLAEVAGFAQIQVTRNVVLDPFADTSSARGFFERTGVLGELNRGFGSTGGELAWNTKIGGFFEIYRWDRAALTVLLGNEMIANDRNDISFNPRSVRWEEAVAFSYAADGAVLQAGVIQQCKHDVDNSDPVDSDEPEVSAISKRVAILTGPYASVIVPRVELGGRLTLAAYARTDYYPSSSEYRFPGNTIGKRWDEIVGNVTAGVRLGYPFGSSARAYLLSWGTYSLPGESLTSDLNYRLEVGLRLDGNSGSFHFFGALEHYFDDLSGPIPQPSTVYYVGLRAGNRLFL